MPDSILYQFCSAVLFLATAAMLTYVSIGRPNLAKRLTAVSSIATCALAIFFMMQSYAGEKEIVLERAGRIERRTIVRERGYFEFVDKPASQSDSQGSRSASRSTRSGMPDDAEDERNRGTLRGFVTRLASAAGGLFGADFLQNGQPCPECPEMVVIEPGYFIMGAPHDDARATPYEQPTSVKRIGRRFAIARTETTLSQYLAFARATGRAAPSCTSADATAHTDPELPVTCVSWSETAAHAAWLSARTGRTYRLPSEAEWEYAARAGAASHGAPAISQQPIRPITASGVMLRRTPQPVASLPPNGFGLHDIGGNVAEFAADCWRDRPSSLPGDGSPAAHRPCDRRALRDASDNGIGTMKRVTTRRPIGVDARSPGIGYRLVRDL